MNNKVRCYTKDGVQREPKDTIVPDHICEMIYKIAEGIRERNLINKDIINEEKPE
jgi:hypothetical protein